MQFYPAHAVVGLAPFGRLYARATGTSTSSEVVFEHRGRGPLRCLNRSSGVMLERDALQHGLRAIGGVERGKGSDELIE